ncbi:Ferric reduction oxidase 2 [Diplonema papillatum]|nr:Ferric reduction oxidase 2 [Diplonema papillatum]
MNAKGRVLAIAALCLALAERGTATVIGASKFTDDFSIEMQVVEDGNLTVFLTCGEDQWCGVGFTADGGSANNQFMLNSDVVVCRSSGTTATCIDSSVGGGRQLVADTQNDVVILDSSPVVNGVWSVTLTRSATTTDVSDLVVSKDLAFIWGTGALIDGVAGAAQFVKHGARSSFVLTSLEALPVIPLEGRKELTDEYLVTVSVDTVNVTVSLTCGEDKWCGFGTTLGGGDNGDQYMLNSDVVICKVVSSLVSCIDSSIGSSRSVSADAENEVEVLDWSEAEDGVWSVTWTRRLDTNNEYDQLYSVRRAFTEGKAFVWGTGDLQSNGDLVKHATKGHFFPEDLQALPTSTPETSAPETSAPDAEGGTGTVIGALKFTEDFSIEMQVVEDGNLTVFLTCGEDQWCGVGFTADGGSANNQFMLNSDVVVCRSSGTTATCIDSSVGGGRQLVADTQNDVVILDSSPVVNGVWSVTLTRSATTTDVSDLVVSKDLAFIWGTGALIDGVAGAAQFVKHGARSSFVLTSLEALPVIPLEGRKELTDEYLVTVSVDTVNVTVSLTCGEDKWCGFGTTLGGGDNGDQYMLNSDVVICKVVSSLVSCIDSSIGSSRSVSADAENEVEVLDWSEAEDGVWSVTWTRRLDTNNEYDQLYSVRRAFTEGKAFVWGTGDLQSNGDLVKHATKGHFFPEDLQALPTSTPETSAPETPTPVALVNSKVFNGDYSIKWALTDTDLVVAMTCKADRWCGLGFSETQLMLGADTIVCWYSPNPTCSDGSVVGPKSDGPKPDAVNNVVVRSSEQSGDTFTIEFSRPLVTGDSADKAVVEGSQGIVWATGPFVSGTIVQHSSRAGTEIDWAPTPVSPAPETPTPVALVNSKVFNGDYSIKWALTDTDLVVAMTCKADRWCGLGFSETQLMLGADTIVCWYSPNPTCSDGSVVGPKSDGPTPDAVNNVVIRSSEQSGDTFTIEFSRPLVTGDSADKAVVEGSQGIVWATGLFASGTIVQHSSRAGTEIDWTGGVEVTPGPDVQPVVTPTPTGSASLGNLQLSEGFGIEWNLTESTGDDTARRLVVRMTCTGTDYCALGLGAGMVGADVMLCFVNNGVPTCQDRKAVEKALPPLDAQQDLEVDGEGEVRDGGFIVTFSRALVTGDDSDSEITLAEPQAVIWAVGPMSGTTPGEHSTRDSGVFIDWVGTAIVPEAVVGTPIDDAILTVVDDSMSAGFEFVTASGASKRQGEALQGGDGEVVAVRVTYVCEKGRWCAMGLNDDGKMTPSDVFICWETFDGKVACSDWHCTEKDICPADALQNIVVEAFTSGPSSWSVVFSRALNTGDPQDRIMSTDTVNFIWATGDADGSSPSQQHDSFGKAVLDVETGTLAVSSGVEETSWHVITAVCLLLGLGLISGIIIAVRPSLGYFFQQSYVGAALSLCFIIAALVVIAVGDAQHYEDRVGEAAVPFGGMAQLAIALAFVLKLKMFSPVLFLMSFPQERALVWHRWIGRFGWLCVTLHFVIMCAKFGEEPQGAGVLFNAELSVSGTTDGQTSVRPVYGFVAWILYTLLVLLGIPKLRRMYYGLFVASHIVLSLGTLICTIVHLPKGWRSYVIFGVPMLLLVLDNLWRLWQQARPGMIEKFETIGTATKVVIRTSDATIGSWGPGCYFYVTVPSVGFMEAHPFSVTTHHSSGRATFYIKNMGPDSFTDRLSKATSQKEELVARIEGPYGKLSFDMDAHDKLILVCGGIGITPMLSTVEYMDAKKTATLVWSVREAKLVGMLQPVLSDLVSRFANLRVLVFYTGKDAVGEEAFASDRFVVTHGRPDFSDILGNFADERSAMSACGPAGLVSVACATVKSSALNIPIHTETFEF